MTLLSLIALLLFAPLADGDGPGDTDDPKKATPHAVQPHPVVPLRVLMLHAPVLSAAAAQPQAPFRSAGTRSTGTPDLDLAPDAAALDAAAAEAENATRPRRLGNARFPSWNLPPQVGNRATVYANVAYGTIGDEFDNEGETRAVGNDFAQQLGLPEIAQLLGLDPEAANTDLITADVGVPGRLTGEVTSVNINIGGSVAVYSNPLFDVSLGADFQAAQQNFESDVATLSVADARGNLDYDTFINDLGIEDVVNGDVVDIRNSLAEANDQLGLGLTIPPASEIPQSIEIDPAESEALPESVESGFQTQALTLFAQAQSRLLSLRGGFQLDLGNEPNPLEGEREVSDRQNAVLLGVTVNYPMSERLRVYGGADGWFTLEGEEEDVTYDEGNSYAAQLGADYAVIPSLTLGAALAYRVRTAASEDGEDIEDSSGYNLGLGPYLNYAPPGSPLTIYLKGGVRDEYRDFTFSLVGENEFAPRAGATLGVVYHL